MRSAAGTSITTGAYFSVYFLRHAVVARRGGSKIINVRNRGR
jgi:hypothetical protein